MIQVAGQLEHVLKLFHKFHSIMRAIFFSLFSLCFLLLNACSEIAESADKQPTDLRTATPEKVMKQSFAGKTTTELAEAGCQCFEIFYNMRENAKKEFDAGDKDAYTRIDKDLLEERAKAKSCVRAVVKPLIGNDPMIAEFEQALMKKCPHSYPNILLLSKIKLKPEE